MHVIRIPLLSANEEEVDVLTVDVVEGQEVRAGARLCTIESTKASADIEAPASGFVRRLGVRAGDHLRVGTVLCVLTPTADTPLEQARPGTNTRTEPEPSAGGVKATRRAAALAAAEGLDLATLGIDGIIKEADVRRVLASRGARSTPPRPEGVAPLGRDVIAKAVIYGAGGHAKVLIDLVREGYPGVEIVGALADGATGGGHVLGVPIVGGFEEVERLRSEGVTLGIQGIGALTSNADRERHRARLLDAGLDVPALVHPRACVEPSAILGAGAQLFAGAIVGSDASIGANTIVNSGVVVSHDCRIGDHVHLTPGAILAGSVAVGDRTVVGMGVTVYLGLSIGADVVVSNGVTVLTNVPDGTLVRS